MNQITFTFDKYKRLKKIYEQNKEEPDKVIDFEGNELVISYVKYLLEHLENQMIDSNPDDSPDLH